MAPPKKQDGNKVKRPMSAYMLWLKDNRSEIAKMVDDPKKVTLISKKAGELWRGMNEKEKEKWQSMAAKAKADYERNK